MGEMGRWWDLEIKSQLVVLVESLIYIMNLWSLLDKIHIVKINFKRIVALELW